jgi:acetyl esterase/lipase
MKLDNIKLWESGTPFFDESYGQEEPDLIPYLAKRENCGAVIVCPGGGYGGKADHEKTPIAEMFNSYGINAFTLDYNVAPCHKFAPLSDVQRAIRVVRSMGYELIAVCGFSAGGHLTCTSATMYNFDAYEKTDDIDKLSARPDAFIPCYPVVTMDREFTHLGSRQNLLSSEWENEELAELFSNEKHITSDTPPCFIWHTAKDSAVPVANSLAFARALTDNGIGCELHIFPMGEHGLSRANAETAPDWATKEYIIPYVARWIDWSVKWLEEIFYNGNYNLNM